MSCRDKLSDVTFVEYTLTAILSGLLLFLLQINEEKIRCVNILILIECLVSIVDAETVDETT